MTIQLSRHIRLSPRTHGVLALLAVATELCISGFGVYQIPRVDAEQTGYVLEQDRIILVSKYVSDIAERASWMTIRARPVPGSTDALDHERWTRDTERAQSLALSEPNFVPK